MSQVSAGVPWTNSAPSSTGGATHPAPSVNSPADAAAGLYNQDLPPGSKEFARSSEAAAPAPITNTSRFLLPN